MARVSASTARTGRGRPKKADVVAPAPTVANDTPKKRGRPSKAAENTEEPVPKSEVISKKRGRPANAATANAVKTVSPAAKRAGRPKKDATAASLNRVAGSPRVSKLRTRVYPVKNKIAPIESPKRRGPPAQAKTDTATATGSRRGRPRKDTSAPIAAKKTSASKKAAGGRGRPRKDITTPVAAKKTTTSKKAAGGRGRPRKDTAPVKTTAINKKAAVQKPVAPRKRRGYTNLEVPDKFAVQLKDLLRSLQEAEAVQEAEEIQEASVEADSLNEIENIENNEDNEDIENINGGAEKELRLAVKPVDVFEDNDENLPVDLNKTTQDEQIEIEVREEIHTIIQDPDSEDPHLQEIIEVEQIVGGSSELTPGLDDNDFGGFAHAASTFQQAIDGTGASSLFGSA